jgi:hypothetical protein
MTNLSRHAVLQWDGEVMNGAGHVNAGSSTTGACTPNAIGATTDDLAALTSWLIHGVSEASAFA